MLSLRTRLAGIGGLVVAIGATGCTAANAPGDETASQTVTLGGTGVTAACTMGWVDLPAGSGQPVSEKVFSTTAPVPDTGDGYSLSDYSAMRVVVSAESVTQISELAIVFYGPTGAEISSAYVPFSELITQGQSLTEIYDESVGSPFNPPDNAATCAVESYS